MKTIVKHCLGFIKCIVNGVKFPRGGISFGRNISIINGNKIEFGSNIYIRSYCDLFAGDFLKIGKETDIGNRCRIAGNVIIGEKVLFGPNVFVCSYDHSYENVERAIIEQPEYTPSRNRHNELLIGDETWIGINCVISGDVHIGKHCVVGANSVVTKDVPSYSVVAGAPAKIIKQYDFEKKEWVSKL